MPLTGDHELTVTFVDASMPDAEITYWSWDFGDGSAVYEGQTPPAHVYPAPGTYTVTLSVASAKGIDTFTDTITIDDYFNRAVTSVVMVDPETGPIGGLSMTVQVSPYPTGVGRTVTLGWYKAATETIADIRSIGTMTWNSGTSLYELLWTFPACVEVSDDEVVNLVAQATGYDGVTQLGSVAVRLIGRGC